MKAEGWKETENERERERDEHQRYYLPPSHYHKKIFNKTTTTIQKTLPPLNTTSRSFMTIAIMKRLTDDCFRPVHPAVRRGLLF